MFFLNWLFSKFRVDRSASSKPDKHALAKTAGSKSLSNETGRGPKTEVKIQGSREALYEVIRQSMTHCGILSASYKFKVLSLDRQGGSYLAMIDLTSIPGDAVLHLADMEAQIVQRAQGAHQIAVSAVYWRLNEMAAVSSALPSSGQAAAPLPAPPGARKPSLSEPIQAEEIAAFRRAMLAASTGGAPHSPEKNQPSRTGLRSPNHFQDFGDTSAVPSASHPALSSTQYGELR